MGRMNESWRRSLTIDAMGDLTAGYTSHTMDNTHTHTQTTVVKSHDNVSGRNILQEKDSIVLKGNGSY